MIKIALFTSIPKEKQQIYRWEGIPSTEQVLVKTGIIGGFQIHEDYNRKKRGPASPIPFRYVFSTGRKLPKGQHFLL
jgi:hypothetical protein